MLNEVTRKGVKRRVSSSDRDKLESRITGLKKEIEELDRAGRIYASRRNHSPRDRRAQDQRIMRLEEIKQEIAALSKRNLQ